MRGAIFVFILFLTCNIHATTIYLKNGSKVEVNYWWEKDGQVCYKKYGGVLCVGKDEVKEIKTEEQRYFPYKTKQPSTGKEGKKEEAKIDEYTEAKILLNQAAADALHYLAQAEQYLHDSQETLKEAQTRYYLTKAEDLFHQSMKMSLIAHDLWEDILQVIDVDTCKTVVDKFRKYLEQIQTVFKKQEQVLKALEQRCTEKNKYFKLVGRWELWWPSGDTYKLLERLRKRIRKDELKLAWLEERYRTVVREEIEAGLELEKYYNELRSKARKYKETK